jgi:hypothetical protein
MDRDGPGRGSAISAEDMKQLSSTHKSDADSNNVRASIPATLPTSRSFELFDSSLARRCVHLPQKMFDSIEQVSGYIDFARAWIAVEAEVSSMQYQLDEMSQGLAERRGIPADKAVRMKNLRSRPRQIISSPSSTIAERSAARGI